MISKNFKGSGHLTGFTYTQLENSGNKYIYEVNSVSTNTTFYNVFKGTKYPEQIKVIMDKDEAYEKYRKL